MTTAATAHKAIPRRVYSTRAEFLTALHDAMAEHVEHAPHLASEALFTNFPQMQTADGPADIFGFVEDATSPYGYRPTFADGFQSGALAIVPHYEGASVARTEGKPLAIPARLTLLNLPSAADLGSDKRAAKFYDAVMSAALSTAAAKIAKAHHADAAKNPLLTDPVALILTTLRSARKDDSWPRMYPAAKAIVVAIGKKQIETAKASGNHALARALAAAFDPKHWTRDALGQALASAAAAKALFPQLPEKFFAGLLSAIIKSCPSAKARKITKDTAGNPMKDAEGKTMYHEVPEPVSPALFLGWQETRDRSAFDLQPLDIGEVFTAE